jgi:hypothetical protein
MARRRPTAVTVIGILNIIFGSLGLLCYVCAGAGFLILYAAFSQAGPQPREMQDLRQLWEAVQRQMPWFGAYMIGNVILSFFLAILLLISGIGLLNMKGWARTLAILYSIITIVTQIAALVLTLAYVNPQILRVTQELMARNPAFRPSNDPFGGGSLMGSNIQSVIGAVIGMIYAIVLLIIMLMPSVSAAFAGRGRRDDYELDRQEDEDDDLGRERRRREEWNE